jgi:hypothetical protein
MAPAEDKGPIPDQSDDSIGVSGESSPTGHITPNVVIPEGRDAFFGYSEEKSIQQVSASL